MSELDRETRALRSWLRDEGPVPLPERVSEAVLRQLASTPQRRGVALASGSVHAGRSPWLAAAAAILVVAVIALASGRWPNIGPNPTAADSSRSAAPPSPSNVAASPPAPTDAPSLSPSPSTSSAQIGSFHWEGIGAVDTPELRDGSGGFVTLGFEDGYVVSDCCGATVLPPVEAADVRFSTDGVNWEPVQLDVEEGTVLSVQSGATDGERVVLAGEYAPCSRGLWQENPYQDCRSRPATWVTDDGRTWQGGQPWTGLDAEAGQSGSWFTDLWAVPGAGWEAAQIFSGFDESDDLDPSGPALYRSSDGLAWSLVAERVAGLDTACTYWTVDGFRAVADEAGNRIATIPCDEGLRLRHSIDGVAYASLDAFGLAQGSWAAARLAGGAAMPWLLGGMNGLGQPALWWSSDLRTWTTTTLPMGPASVGRVTALARDGNRVIAMSANDVGDGLRETTTWVTQDGRTWTAVDVQPSSELDVEAIAIGPGGLLGFGSIPSTDEEELFAVWRLVPGSAVKQP